jgi:hypothetical protein
MNLKELRAKYPNIKSRTKKGFLQKLKEAEGLGDAIEAVTEATGIKKAVEWLADGKDCGCSDRKKRYNEKYRFNPNCLVRSEYDYLTEYIKRHNPKRFEKGDVHTLITIYSRVFKVRPKVCMNCNSAIRVMNDVYNSLMKVYNEYN